MYLCNIIKDISCSCCPFQNCDERTFSSEIMVKEALEEIRDNAIFCLNKIKEEEKNV